MENNVRYKNLYKGIELFRKIKSGYLYTGLILTLSIYIGLKNYLLFHIFIELSSVIVSFIVFIIALNSYQLSPNSYFLYLGIAFGFVGVFDLIHSVAYKNMGVFPGNTSNLATQLWIIARYIESASILISFLGIKKRQKPTGILLSYIFISFVLILSVFYFEIFPDCFVDGVGLTFFKIVSEYIIIGTLTLSLFIMHRRKESFYRAVYNKLQAAITLIICSEICFTLYSDVYGIYNMLGHIMKLISMYCIFRGIIIIGLKEPYKLLFSRLDRVEEDLRYTNDKLEKQSAELSVREAEVKQVEELLMKTEEGYKMLVELSEYSIVAHTEGSIIFANNNAAKLFDAGSPEALRGINVLTLVHPEYRDIIKKRQRSILDRKDILHPQEFKIISLKGREVYVESMATPFIFMGKPSLLIIVRDISEKKLLKEAIEQDKIKTEAFANISHDLKTPINVFFASLQLLELYLKNGEFTQDIEKVYKHIRTMKQNSYRVIKLVNNLVDITKIGAGELQLNLKNLNIVSVIEDIGTSVAGYMEDKGIAFVFDTDIEEKVMALDPDKIERIMLNLLSNAIKFTNPGGSIKVNIYDITKGVIISVKDTGTGIPEDKLVTIFDRFKQVEDTLVRNGQGSGIGLSLVKSLVELHGGNIKAISHWGIGTEFIIELPVRLVDQSQDVLENFETRQNNVERINIEFSDIYM